MADENLVAGLLRGLPDLVGGGVKEPAQATDAPQTAIEKAEPPKEAVDGPQSPQTGIDKAAAPKEAVDGPQSTQTVQPIVQGPVTAEPRTAAMPVDVSSAPKSLTFEQIKGMSADEILAQLGAVKDVLSR